MSREEEAKAAAEKYKTDHFSITHPPDSAEVYAAGLGFVQGLRYADQNPSQEVLALAHHLKVLLQREWESSANSEEYCAAKLALSQWEARNKERG